MTHQTGAAAKKIDHSNFHRLEEDAAKIIPQGWFGYIRGGVGDEWTMRRNVEALNEKFIMPRVVTKLDHPDTSTSIFNTTLAFPCIMAPTAAHALCHAEGEKETARGVAQVGTIMCVSAYANIAANDLVQVADKAPWWFQVYSSNDQEVNKKLIDQAKDCGAKAVILTADETTESKPGADKINCFSFPLTEANLARFSKKKGQLINRSPGKFLQKIKPADIEKLASYSALPIIVKGIQTPEDAMLSIAAGAAAVYVSNHGGRHMDGSPGSFDVLPSIAQAVGGRVPIIFDSGIRRGQHVFKALASGADVVALGRPILYALALGGSQGVADVFTCLNKEFSMVMRLSGSKNIQDVKRASIS